MRDGKQLLDQVRSLGVREQLEGQQAGAATCAPPGPAVEELGARGCDHDQWKVPQPLSERCDKVEEAVVGPVEVVEDQENGLHTGELLQKTPPRCEPLGSSIIGLLVSRHAEERDEMSSHPVRVGGGLDRKGRDHAGELGLGHRSRIGFEHSCLCLDHLAKRPEAHVLAVGERSAAEPGDRSEDAVVNDPMQLADETGLADPGDADHRHEAWLPLAQCCADRIAQGAELLLPADERCRSQPLGPDWHSGHARLPGRDAKRLSLRLDCVRSRVFDRDLGSTIRRLVDEDRAGLGCRLKPRRGVDDVAGRHALACVRARVERNQRLSGRDPDPDLELTLRRERVSDRKGRPNRSLGVVLVRDRRAEHGHDRVADVLLHGASEALELRAHAGVVRLQQPADVLWVHALRAGREADEVAEEAGDDLALLARCRRDRERRAALGAELGVLGVLRSAGRTGHAVMARSASPSRM